MNFSLERKIKRNVVEDYKLKLSQTEDEPNLLNAQILSKEAKIEFKSRSEKISSFSDVIQVKLSPNIDEDTFNSLVSDLNEEQFTFHNMNYSLPVESDFLIPYEVHGKSPTIKIGSKVNFYNEQIEINNEINGTPDSIYRRAVDFETKKSIDFFSAANRGENNTGKDILHESIDFANINSNKELYPCHSEITISRNEIEVFRPILKELKFYSLFMNETERKMNRILSYSNQRNESEQNYQFNLLNNIISSMSDVDFNEHLVSRQESSTINFITKLEALGKLQKQSLYNSNYKKIVETGAVPVETIFYKITKFEGLQTTNPVKSFMVPNYSDVVNFVDTEVNYNNNYTYSISAYVVVYGVTYSYNLVDQNYDSRQATFEVRSEPNPIVTKIDFISKSITISTNPPLSPDVRFINESSSTNLIKMAFLMRKGIEKKYFINLLERDSMLEMKTDPVDNKVTFENAIEPLTVQVMRLDKRPKSIYDFKDSIVTTITKQDDDSRNMELIIHKENVFPNKKYYYIFRTQSVTGMVSNPSPVYEVELIKDSDKSKISVSIIKVDMVKDFDPTRKFRNMLQVKPAFIHTVLLDKREDTSTMPNSNTDPLSLFSLGKADYPIWGRKFKIRIKSNESGKILDLNLNFSLIKERIKEDLS